VTIAIAIEHCPDQGIDRIFVAGIFLTWRITHRVSYESISAVAMTVDASEKSSSATVTRLLNQVCEGDAQASAELLPLVYEQLRALAARKMREERPDLTLQATALVHEAYVRLVDQTHIRQWDGRWHFFAAAAEAMRRILVENARRKGRMKRGGDKGRVDLAGLELTVNDPPDDLLALDEALEELSQKHPQEAQLVKLRYFAGMTVDEAAQALGISPRTAARSWIYARAWLYTRITDGQR
jgi:RNA polymerase sigma factor (TIGR02999 family)